MWWTVGRLKRVALDGDELLISNFLTEIRVARAAARKQATSRQR